MTRHRLINPGDIVLIALDPTAGTEIRGTRPVLVLSNAEFNRSGRALIAPITQGGNIQRIEGWAVTLMGTGTITQGVVVVSHCRVIDLSARGAKIIEAVPAEVTGEVLAKLQAMVDS
ncbi:MAG: type II toxin-antitoxin system PemK/MazF family toxin [Gallionella sp.]|nr:type II toxin-antitoxin system PemK/MazF family toxin [Gallionella sp.]